MSNMKVVALVAHEQRKAKVEIESELEALTKDFYAALAAALEPLQDQITQLRADVDELKHSLTGDGR